MIGWWRKIRCQNDWNKFTATRFCVSLLDVSFASISDDRARQYSAWVSGCDLKLSSGAPNGTLWMSLEIGVVWSTRRSCPSCLSLVRMTESPPMQVARRKRFDPIGWRRCFRIFTR